MKYNPAQHHRRTIRLKGYDYAQPGVYFVTICVQARECVLGNVVGDQMALNDVGRIADQFWPAVAEHFADVAIDTWVTMPNHVHANIFISRGAAAAPDGAGMDGETGEETSSLHGWNRRGAVAAPDGVGMDGETGKETGEETSSLHGWNRRGAVAAPNGAGMGAETGGETPPLRAGVVPAPRQSPVLGQIVAFFKYQTTKSINQMREMPGARFWQRNYWEHIVRNDADLTRIREYIESNPARWTEDQLHPDAPPNKFNRA
jgi:putative transposase